MTELRRRSVGKRAKSPSEPPPQSPQVALVLSGIGEALRLVGDAERAYRIGDHGAAALQAAADRTHRELLRRICELSEDEADQVEPMFTELEIRLLLLPAAPPDPPLGRA